MITGIYDQMKESKLNTANGRMLPDCTGCSKVEVHPGVPVRNTSTASATLGVHWPEQHTQGCRSHVEHEQTHSCSCTTVWAHG